MTSPPRRKADARYRGHPFKNGNLTIALTNLPPEGKVNGTWWAVAYLGAGKTYGTQVLNERNRQEAWRIVKKEIGADACKELKESLKDSVLSLTAPGEKLQQLYSENETSSTWLHPVDLMDRLRDCLAPFDPDVRKLMGVEYSVVDKADIHLRQVMAVAAICDVVRKTNQSAWKAHSEKAPANDRKVQGAIFKT